MPWQDIVILITQIIFTLALFPSIISKDKPAFITSAINTFFLFVLSFTYFTMNLWGALIGTLVLASLWGVLAVQKYNLQNRAK